MKGLGVGGEEMPWSDRADQLYWGFHYFDRGIECFHLIFWTNNI
jgi:hypothetical protein